MSSSQPISYKNVLVSNMTAEHHFKNNNFHKATDTLNPEPKTIVPPAHSQTQESKPKQMRGFIKIKPKA